MTCLLLSHEILLILFRMHFLFYCLESYVLSAYPFKTCLKMQIWKLISFLSTCSSMTGSLTSMGSSCLQQREAAHPAASYSYMFGADPLTSLGSYGSRAPHCGSGQGSVSGGVNSHPSYGANTPSSHGGAASQYHGKLFCYL